MRIQILYSIQKIPAPFGSPLIGRTYQAETLNGYRYSFNGKEKTDEISGEGNEMDFGARIYDGRLGRWLSIDPLEKKYPNLSPYSFADNDPTVYIDPDGQGIHLPLWFYFWEPQAVQDARRFAKATGGTFTKFSKDFEKEHGYRAQVSIHKTETYFYLQRAISSKLFNSSTTLSNEKDANVEINHELGFFTFKTGGDYSHLFAPVTVELASAPAVAIAEEIAAFTVDYLTEIIITPILVPPDLVQGDKSIKLNSIEQIANSQIASMKTANLCEQILQSKGERIKTESELEAAENQLDGISKKQERLNKEVKGEKQNKIRSDKKSQQRFNNAAKRVKSMDDLK